MQQLSLTKLVCVFQAHCVQCRRLGVYVGDLSTFLDSIFRGSHVECMHAWAAGKAHTVMKTHQKSIICPYSIHMCILIRQQNSQKEFSTLFRKKYDFPFRTNKFFWCEATTKNMGQNGVVKIFT